MSKEIRAELRALHNAATKDPWGVPMPFMDGEVTALTDTGKPFVLCNMNWHMPRCNADRVLIIAMRNAMPGLLDDLDEKDAEIERLRARCEALERALNYPSCSNPECHWYTPCDTCKADSDFCDHLCNDEGETELDMSEACPFWIFDEARFAQDRNHT